MAEIAVNRATIILEQVAQVKSSLVAGAGRIVGLFATRLFPILVAGVDGTVLNRFTMTILLRDLCLLIFVDLTVCGLQGRGRLSLFCSPNPSESYDADY